MPMMLAYIRNNVKAFIEFIDPLNDDAENLEPADLINLIRVDPKDPATLR